MKPSEAMLLGRRLGVDPQVLADIINNSTGRCWSSEVGLQTASHLADRHLPVRACADVLV
jgi:3-hydroxyisobutyrate dehydrogenase